ncbi:hypothetical protein ACLQ28_13010 [Micromonospora sp. DT201]|uniref:hypothetical protein n=1 Tax=Micromonospora sp. DT201 TaxID=3393442 RepID=UPI003CF7E1EE
MTRRVALVLAASATAFVLLLCLGLYVVARVFPNPSRAVAADVVGSWSGADGVTLTLNPDHTFEAQQVPVQIQAPERYSTAWTGSGEWRLSSPDRYRHQDVHLVLDGYGIPVCVKTARSGTRLYLNYRDQTEGYRYWLNKV